MTSGAVADVVVVAHDNRDDLDGLLTSLDGQPVGEVVLVDSGSGDGTGARARELRPGTTVLETTNLGFGAGANLGVARTSAKVVVIANADVSFEPGAITALAAALRDDDQVGIVGPRVRYPDGRDQASARRHPGLRAALGHALFGLWWPGNRWSRSYRRLDEDPGVPVDVDWVSGCALAVRQEAFAAVGGFDPGYFLFLEDVDLADRVRAAGWRIRYHPDAQVIHRVGGSTRSDPASARRAHAASIRRYAARRYGPGAGFLAAAAARLWLASAWIFDRTRGRSRSTTGE